MSRLPGRSERRSCSGDDGTGLVASISGLLIFLVFLLFVCQLLLGLFARSTVSAAAYDGAHLVASKRTASAGDDWAVQNEAESRMRQLLGTAGQQANFDWTGTDADWVTVRVQVPAPRLGWPGFTRSPSTIERGAQVRVEAIR